SAAQAVDVRSIRHLRQRCGRYRSHHLFHFLRDFLSVPDPAFDGGAEVDRPQVDTPTGRTPLWRNYALLIYTALALGVVLILGNAIIGNHNVRFDLTPNKRYSLSEFDKRVLSNLNQNVKVMAFVRTEDPAYLMLQNLLVQAAAYTPRLTFQIIDVNKAP